MASHDSAPTSAVRPERPQPNRATLRTLVIGIMAFATLVDLFATQAILPALVENRAMPPGLAAVRGDQ